MGSSAVRGIIVGCFFCKVTIISSFRVGISKYKNIDHWDKEICVNANESSLLHDLMMTSAQ